ncbi:hypothetical protein TH61_07610 [Rufibacter sp. DG15C]|uniref:hypothetical protein n=1 Tax=Rufibacter sp. DG15C TaxID=1379909 RepID=UPI00078D5003|nr:hypothetical protein [Rufibacter sp. DG15C]AMM51070.1 hypothetical protein TH61_07610 [Rufibacter sp. DG15C]
MRIFFRQIALAIVLLLTTAVFTDTMAQRTKKRSKPRKEVRRKGPDGRMRGQAPDGNGDRKMLLEREQAIAKAKTNGGVYNGPRLAIAKNTYDKGKGGFSQGKYENKTNYAKTKKSKGPRKVIDRDNPNGKLYKKGQKKRNKRFLFF